MLTDYFDIDSILSLIKKATWLGGGFDEKMVGGFNGILNILFSIGKSIVEASMVLVDKIYSVDILNKSIDSAFSSSNAVWDNLFKTFGTFFVMMVFIYGIKDFFRHGMERLFIRLLILGSLIVVGTGFYSNGANFLKKVNTVSTNAQTELVGIMAPNVSKPAEQLVEDLKLTPPDTVTGEVQNMMYYRFVIEPFLLMNFGKTDVSTKDIQAFTAKQGEYTSKREGDIEDLVKNKADKNSYLTIKKLGQKWAVLLNSGIDFVIVAGVILFIAVMNFLLQIFILMLILLSPVFLARSLLPDNEHVLMNAGKLIFGSFAGKVLLGLGFGFIFMVLGWLDSAFGAVSFLTVIAALFVKIILAILIYKNWSWFVSVIQHQRVDRVSLRQRLPHFRKDVTPKEESLTPQSIQPPKEVLEPTSYSNPNSKTDYMDNIILGSTMDEVQPTRTEKLAQKAGYFSERGLGGSLKDGMSQLYQESKLANGVDKLKDFNPKESLNDRFSSIANAYLGGQFEALDKHGFVNDPDVPTDSLNIEELDGMTRFETEGSEKNRTQLSEEEERKYRRNSSWSGATESFEERLAKLRGEPYEYVAHFDEFKIEPKEWTQNYSYNPEEPFPTDPNNTPREVKEEGKTSSNVRYSTEDNLRKDREIQEELSLEKESGKTSETL
ncbi:CD3337/EF1877 family mobilome membrane protein [Enterococcus sp. AZ029]|uniref:CD3337/EF1877 family mobilome membrane protein n=1 Tax=Enterococcus sp. AZ029 TaxID=2774841 RepID=UPI003F24C9B2